MAITGRNWGFQRASLPVGLISAPWSGAEMKTSDPSSSCILYMSLVGRFVRADAPESEQQIVLLVALAKVPY